MIPKLTDVSSKFYINRIQINSGGYDEMGSYWGRGSPLYWACSEDSSVERFLRAYDRRAAKEEISKEFPNARFFQ